MTTEQRRLAAAAMQIGRRFGVGGHTWRAYTFSGEGVREPITVGGSSLVTAFIVRERVYATSNAAPGVAVGADQWRLIAGSASGISEGMVVVSTTTGAAYTVGSVDTDQGYLTAVCLEATAP